MSAAPPPRPLGSLACVLHFQLKSHFGGVGWAKVFRTGGLGGALWPVTVPQSPLCPAALAAGARGGSVSGRPGGRGGLWDSPPPRLLGALGARGAGDAAGAVGGRPLPTRLGVGIAGARPAGRGISSPLPGGPTVLEASTYSRPARSHPLPTLKEFKARRPSPLEPPANSLEGGGRAGVVLGMCGLFQETTRAQDPVLAPPTTLANFPCPSRLSSPPQVRGHVSCVAQSPGPGPRSFRERGPRTFQGVIFSKEYDQRHSSATLWRSRLR